MLDGGPTACGSLVKSRVAALSKGFIHVTRVYFIMSACFAKLFSHLYSEHLRMSMLAPNLFDSRGDK
jgi:hypothetical protein